MPWTRLLANWPTSVQHLSTDFRYLDLHELNRTHGNRAEIIAQLAQAHDLTMSEASETLGDWLRYKAAYLDRRAAA